MAFLTILIPARGRVRSGAAPVAAAAGGEYAYVTSQDGSTVLARGRCAPALLPKADSVVAVVADADVGWQRVTLPKAPPARLRAALAGMLEERLLDEPEALHLALAPGAAAGQPTWVATLHRDWLAAHLAALEKAGVGVDRVVPMAWPDALAQGHFWRRDGDDDDAPPMLTWSDAQGVLSLRLRGELARTLAPQWQAQQPRWSASPAVAAAAERWLAAPVQVVDDEERALQATRSLWNLRQFDLVPRHRGTLALREAWKRVRGPDWRPVRWGVAVLVLLQLAGLNVMAWQQRNEIASRQQAMVELLRATHPQVRAVLDAPLQMQRETAQLRAAAGRSGDADFEALLAAAASAWPEDQGPAPALRFEPGRLTLAAGGWTAPQVEAFERRLRSGGWQLEAGDGQLTITRAADAAGARS
jgi:general secretion pathway protein L